MIRPPERVLPLDSPRIERALAGGKGFALSRLVRAGLPVPRGFVLTTEAYRACRATGKVSPEISAAVRAALEALGDGPVAVRSSATTEDGSHASFAGQHDTVLNVRGPDGTVRAIERCWRSLDGERSLAYRKRLGLDAGEIAMAVVIQEMIPAEASGLLFTSSPMSADRTECLIEAAWGLGESIVAGEAAPDSIVLDARTGRIKRRIIGDKRTMTVPGEQGTRSVPVEPERRRRPVLGGPSIAQLFRLGRASETLLGSPQDVEWAIAGGRIWLLQSRPVTAGSPAGDDDWPVIGEKPPQPFDLWTRVNVGEVWPDPVTPLSACGIPEMLNGITVHALPGLSLARETQWARRLYGHIYYNEGALVHLFHRRLGLPIALMHDSFGSRRALHEGDGSRIDPRRLVRSASHLLRSAWIAWRDERRLPRLMSRVDEWIRDSGGEDLRAMQDRELREHLPVWFERATGFLNTYAQVSSRSMFTFGLLRSMLSRWCGDDRAAHDLIGGLEGIQSAEIGPSLHDMASRLRQLGVSRLEEDPEAALRRLRNTPAARPVLLDLDRFLERFGHRCAGEGEVMNPRWAERPEQVVELVGAYLKGGADPIETHRRQKKNRERATAAVRARLGIGRRVLFDALLGRSQHLARLRENGRDRLNAIGFPAVRVYRELARRWSERGWLRAPDDLYFLTFPEIESIIDAGDPEAAGIRIAPLTDSRRRAYRRWFAVEPPVALDRDGKPVPLPVSEGARSLEGVPVCGGRVRGTARVITSPADAVRLTKGEILITRATDTGWTPVFALIGGMVLEIGGQLSHGAIVAREYGVPAVANVSGATTLIRDGSTITLDGWTGRVDCQE